MVQWGLEFRTNDFRIHLKTERFKVRISNGEKKNNNNGGHFVRFSNGPPFENRTIQNGCFKLGRFIYKEEIIYSNIKQPRLAIVWYSNGPDHSKTETKWLTILTKMADHSKTERYSKTERHRPSEFERVRNSSPHCC